MTLTLQWEIMSCACIRMKTVLNTARYFCAVNRCFCSQMKRQLIQICSMCNDKICMNCSENSCQYEYLTWCSQTETVLMMMRLLLAVCVDDELILLLTFWWKKLIYFKQLLQLLFLTTNDESEILMNWDVKLCN